MVIMNMAYLKSSGGGGWKPGSNTILYWTLKENANDSSGNNRNGTPTSSVTFSSTDGAYIPGYNRITIPQFTLTTDFTINIWIKFTSTSGRMYTDWSSNKRNILIHHVNSSKLSWLVGNGSSSQQELQWDDTVTYNTFQNYIFVKNGTSLTIYRNGSSIGNKTSTYNPSGTTNSGNDMMIGNTSGENYTCYMKYLILESKAWTSDEVTAYYNSTKGEFGL